jgi:hypothetical protein
MTEFSLAVYSSGCEIESASETYPEQNIITNMKSYDFDAVAYDGAVYCTQCLPEGITTESDGVSPIFADSEWDAYPVCDHCHGVHDYVSLTDYGRRNQTVVGCFCGIRGLEIAMTVEQAESGSHQGQCDDDIAALLRVPAIASQLDAIGADQIRAALKEYGAWDDDELADDAQNRARALWSACCDAKESNRELFS